METIADMKTQSNYRVKEYAQRLYSEAEVRAWIPVHPIYSKRPTELTKQAFMENA